jgi:hypothetical protein
LDRNQIIEHALSLPSDAIRRGLTMAIRETFPEKRAAIAQDSLSNIRRFAEKGHCRVEATEGFTIDDLVWVEEGEADRDPEIGWFTIHWDGHELEFVSVSISEGFHRSPFCCLVADSDEVIDQFCVDLEEFANLVEGAVLVFDDGCWQYNEDLYQDIQGSTFDNLILPTGLVETIRGDIERWLDSREVYQSHGIPWKRGIILVGPPGNGKTHLIKSLVNHFDLSALYVRNFGAEQDEYAENIKKVFDRARSCAPSLLILEDLDSLVNARNRSYFLNELDGFVLNTGVFVVASANDPGKLDPALVNRPSRFDRRYVFELPTVEERARYLQFFTSRLVGDLQLLETDAMTVAEQTDGFSYAYLKELVLSSMMSWIEGGRLIPMSEVMTHNVAPLVEQMSLTMSPTGFEDEDAEDDSSDMAGKMRRAQRKMRKFHPGSTS